MQYSALQVSQAECVGQPGSQQQVTALGHQLLLQSQFRKLYFYLLQVNYFHNVFLFLKTFIRESPENLTKSSKLFFMFNKVEKV